MPTPVLIGMNNPYSDDPRHDLYPLPERSAGGRLYDILWDAARRARGASVIGNRVVLDGDLFLTRSSYATAFERYNVLHARTWSAAEARRVGGDFRERLAGRNITVLGVQTLKALGLARPRDWAVPTRADDGTVYTLIPHPSGLCREYNDPALRTRVGKHLLGLFRASDALLY